MDTSLFLAKFFGIYLTVVGIAFMFNRKTYSQIIKNEISNHALFFYGGFIALMMGIFLVMIHNVWSNDWRVVVTILAWITLAKGLFRTLLPNVSSNLALKIISSPKVLAWASLIITVVGLYLLKVGF